jgi:hypothetical protein
VLEEEMTGWGVWCSEREVWERVGRTIFQVPGLSIKTTTDDSEFNLLQQLPLDARPLAEAFPRLFERLTRFQHELEWNPVRLGGLLVKVEAEDGSVVFRRVELVFGDLFRIQGSVFADAHDD